MDKIVHHHVIKFCIKVMHNEKAFFLSLGTLILFFFESKWFKYIDNHGSSVLISIILFPIVLYTTFSISKHAESLAHLLKEPYGTLLMTLSIVTIETILIASAMLLGKDAPTLARDTLYATFMITINGLVGIALIIGALRYREQEVNLQGARIFLCIIILLGVLGLVLPNYTTSTPGPTLSKPLSLFLAGMSLFIYVVFLNIQTTRHRHYFVELGFRRLSRFSEYRKKNGIYSAKVHCIFLVLYLLLFALLNHVMALPIEHIANQLYAPSEIGGIIVTILVLSPEATSSIQAALENHIQRAINILLGALCAMVCLTIPTVLVMGVLSGHEIILGLSKPDVLMLLLTLLISLITFGNAKTNILQGLIHLILFCTYLFLLFDSM